MTGVPRGAQLRRARAAAAVALLAVVAVRCASPGIPPGGPEDTSPPQLLRASPESGATSVRPREIELEFDEVVAEVPVGAGASGASGAAGAGSSPSLASIVIVSPRAGAVRVDWQRDRVTIRPRNGFRDSTTYTVTMLPGLADLRQNVRDTAIVTVFSTGGRIATGRLGGVVFDWVQGRGAARALVEAIAPDSTTYLAVADSVGRFTLVNLPPGSYVVRGVLDANGNRARDEREAFDTMRVVASHFQLGDSARVELLAFVHDTIGPGVTVAEPVDSVTLRLTFDRPLDPQQPLDATRFRVIARDSSVVAAREVLTRVAYDSLRARRQQLAADSAAARDTTRRPPPTPPPARTPDTAAARRDTTRRREAPPPVPSRPSPPTELVVILAQPLRPNTLYRVVVMEQRSVSSVARTRAERGFTTPRPAPPPAARDTAPRLPGDTTRRPPGDTTTRRPR